MVSSLHYIDKNSDRIKFHYLRDILRMESYSSKDLFFFFFYYYYGIIEKNFFPFILIIMTIITVMVESIHRMMVNEILGKLIVIFFFFFFFFFFLSRANLFIKRSLLIIIIFTMNIGTATVINKILNPIKLVLFRQEKIKKGSRRNEIDFPDVHLCTMPCSHQIR